MTSSVLPKERGVGTWNLANEFVEAGDKLQGLLSTLGSFPLYLLYGHGIELALKAFLISQGVTDNALRGMGHDLTKTLTAARAHDSFEPLSDHDIQIIELLNPYYKGKEFEYLMPGVKNLPQLDGLGDVARQLLATLRPIIWKAVHLHLDQTKAASRTTPAAE